MFDMARTVSIAGTVKALQITNPHGWLRIVAPDGGGAPAEWSIELGGPGQLDRIGLGQGAVHAGDKVTVRIHPFRDGSYGGQFVSVTLPGGQTIGQRLGPA